MWSDSPAADRSDRSIYALLMLATGLLKVDTYFRVYMMMIFFAQTAGNLFLLTPA